jgi:amino acid transporter
MSNSTQNSTPSGGVSSGETTRLRGKMGFLGLALAVLAFSGPLAVVVGYVPFVIIFQGVGAPWAYGVAAIVLLIFSVGFTRMARTVPNPGGFYAFVTQGLGKPAGLAASFIALCGYGLLVFGSYVFFGVFANQLVYQTFNGPDIPWWALSIIAWLAVGIFGYFNIDLSARVLGVVMVIEVVLIMAFNIATLINGGPEGVSVEAFSIESLTSGSSFGIAILFAVTCYLGFESTAVFREEVRDPSKTIPRATYFAVIFIGALYTFSTWIVTVAVGPSKVTEAASNDPAGLIYGAMGNLLGETFVQVVSVLMLTSLTAAMLSGHNVISRYGYSLGVDGILPRNFGVVHPKHGSPSRASVATTIAAALVLIGFIIGNADPVLLYGSMSGLGGFILMILLLLASIAVVGYFRKKGAVKDSSVWHTIIAPVLAVIGLLTFVYLGSSNLNMLVGGTPEMAITFQLAIVLLIISGFVTALVLKKYKPSVYSRIGRTTD